MRSERGEVTRREMETPGETRFNVTPGHVRRAPNQADAPDSERASCKLNPANVNNIWVIVAAGSRA